MGPNLNHWKQLEEARQMAQAYQDKLDRCPVPFTQIQDCIMLEVENVAEFHEWMSNPDN